MSYKKEELNEYYSRVHATYDKGWFNKSQLDISEQMINDNFNKKIELNTDSLIIDYGGGSGKDSQYFYKRLNLKNKVLCMDPSPDMIKVAEQKEGVQSLLFDPSTISKDNNNVPQKYQQVDMIFIAACSHFILPQDRKRIFNMLRSLLKPKGVIALRNRPDTIKHLPFPSIVSTVPFKKYLLIEQYNQIISECELKGTMKLYQVLVDIPKEDWYYFLTNKMWSNLRTFTDEQMNDGVQEIKYKYQNQDRLKFFDYQLLITLTKY